MQLRSVYILRGRLQLITLMQNHSNLMNREKQFGNWQNDQSQKPNASHSSRSHPHSVSHTDGNCKNGLVSSSSRTKCAKSCCESWIVKKSGPCPKRRNVEIINEDSIARAETDINTHTLVKWL